MVFPIPIENFRDQNLIYKHDFILLITILEAPNFIARLLKCQLSQYDMVH